MQAHSPMVSVILPVFNGGDYLLPAVMSVVQQSFTDWELLVMDDGSSDDAFGRLQVLKDPRIKLFSDGMNKGLSARLNEAVAASSGRYIARMDADDFCFPDRLEKQVHFLNSHLEVDLLSSAAIAFNSRTMQAIGLLPHRESHEQITRQPWRGMYMAHPTWMGRAEWFRRFGYKTPEIRRAEDQELLLRACTASRYHSLPDVLLAYRQSDFDFGKTLIARKSLLHAQMRIFFARRQFGYLVQALSITAVKLAIDMIATLPGLNRLFFKRMSRSVPEDVYKTFVAVTRQGRHMDGS